MTSPLRYGDYQKSSLKIEYLDSPCKGGGESRSFNQNSLEPRQLHNSLRPRQPQLTVGHEVEPGGA